MSICPPHVHLPCIRVVGEVHVAATCLYISVTNTVCHGLTYTSHPTCSRLTTHIEPNGTTLCMPSLPFPSAPIQLLMHPIFQAVYRAHPLATNAHMHRRTDAHTISSMDVSFTTDGSIQARLTHINTVIMTLQSLNGPGTGCPAVSTTLCAQQKDLQNGGTAAPAPSPSPWHPHPPPLAPQCSLTLSCPQFTITAGILTVSVPPSIPAQCAHLPCWHRQLHRINGIELLCQCLPSPAFPCVMLLHKCSCLCKHSRLLPQCLIT